MRGMMAGVFAVAVCACSPDDAPAGNAIALVAPKPSASPIAATPPAPTDSGVTRDWLVGAWSYEDSCATDFSVHFEADGTVDNSGDTGRWEVDNGRVTETVTGRYEPGDEATARVDPPLVRTYLIERIDQTHAVIRIDGRKVPILRC